MHFGTYQIALGFFFKNHNKNIRTV
uniref:Uncharacterized protein n=1 Tax=Anguilla anguilla TaxID=7936 RepID=A0A0E9QLX9_ANGAN